MFRPVLLLGVTDAMAVMQEEIFGPILPVVTYDGLDEAIAYVNTRPRPLELYFFGTDKTSQCSARTPFSILTTSAATQAAGLPVPEKRPWTMT